MSADSLGDRMKQYEGQLRLQLMPKVPVIARFDGKAFHTFTKGMQKPYDERLQHTMWDTAKELCKQIQGAALAYVQSDEISVLILDTQGLDSQGWFSYDLQKMCSVGAAIASVSFNDAFVEHFERPAKALFDARFWNLPKHDVANYFVWRQQDAVRNSIQSLGQSEFSHKTLHGLSCDQIQDKLFMERSINWNDKAPAQKRGVCIEKRYIKTDAPYSPIRSHWVVDEQIPIFTQDRSYIEIHLDSEHF